MVIKRLTVDEVQKALDLAWDGFVKFVAKDFEEEGVMKFFKFVTMHNIEQKLNFYGAYSDGGVDLLGMIAICSSNNQIALFFVTPKLLGVGIGRSLIEYVVSVTKVNELYVQAVPSAYRVYKSLGFEEVGKERVEFGMRYTPMKLNIEEVATHGEDNIQR